MTWRMMTATSSPPPIFVKASFDDGDYVNDGTGQTLQRTFGSGEDALGIDVRAGTLSLGNDGC